MGAKLRYLWIIVLMLPAWAGDGVQTIVQGQSATLPRNYAIGDVAVADPRVCDFVVKDSRREIYINGRASGNTTITIWDAQGTQRDVVPVIVTPVDVADLKQRVKSLVGGDEPPVQFVRRGDDIVMVGEVGSEAALSQVQSLTNAEPRLRSEVRLGGAALDNLADTVTKAINRPGITARRVRDRIVLEGIAYSSEAAQHAEKIASIYNPAVLNLLEVRNTGRTPGERPLVYMDVYFIEIKRSALRSFGISWSPGASRKNSNEGVGGLLSSSLGFVIDLLPKLQLARQRGEARILEHPSLIVKSGEKGDFFSGTEIPYPSAQQTQFKEVGIRIEAEPISYGHAVDMKLNISVSAPAAGVNGSIDRRSIATSAYCNNGETLVLGGLWNNGRNIDRNKVPSGIDTSSALFSLALSKDFQSQQSDFLIFVQPRVATASERGADAVRQWDSLQQALTEQPKKIRGQPDRWDRAPRSSRAERAAQDVSADDAPTLRTAALEAPIVADRRRKKSAEPTDSVLQLPEALQ